MYSIFLCGMASKSMYGRFFLWYGIARVCMAYFCVVGQARICMVHFSCGMAS